MISTATIRNGFLEIDGKIGDCFEVLSAQPANLVRESPVPPAYDVDGTRYQTGTVMKNGYDGMEVAWPLPGITVERETRGSWYWVHVMSPIGSEKNAPHKASAAARKWVRELGGTTVTRVSGGGDYNATAPGMTRYSVCYGFQGLPEAPAAPAPAQGPQEPPTGAGADEFARSAEESFDSTVVRFLCRRPGARNWIEQERSMVVDWAARALRRGGEVVRRRSGDYLVRAGEVAVVCRPHKIAQEPAAPAPVEGPRGPSTRWVTGCG